MRLTQTVASYHRFRVLLVGPVVATLFACQVRTLIEATVFRLRFSLQQLAGLNDFAIDMLDQHIACKVSGKFATMSIEDGKERDVRVVVDVLLDDESTRRVRFKNWTSTRCTFSTLTCPPCAACDLVRQRQRSVDAPPPSTDGLRHCPTCP